MRFGDPCQDAGEGFGFQEESEVEALLDRVSTSCAYFSESDKPCDCNQGIAAAGQFRPSLLSHANRPSTFSPECLGIECCVEILVSLYADVTSSAS